MEKNEKIKQKQLHTIRAVLASVFVVGSVLLLWVLLSMEDTLPMVPAVGSQQQQSSEEGDEQEHHRPLRKNPMLVPVADQRQEQQQEQQQQVLKKSKSDSEPLLVQRVQVLDHEVRQIKASLPAGSFMETDEKGVAASKRLQDATRLLLAERYGDREPYRVKVGLKFQPSNPTTAEQGEDGSFVIELAPSTLQPHSIFTFLEIARHWSEKKGAFHRRANHVLQVMVRGNKVPHLAFQEYSKEYPHQKGTVGYAGRPSGPAWYVSIQDNTDNHGPGSQQQANPYEADSCFGKIVEGFQTTVLDRVTKMPGSGFLEASAHVLIDSMTILVPKVDGEYEEWLPIPPITEFEKM
ncbi:hypothetical protein ACA910_018411 [Epithemia clementina (nom. ined.)]